MIFAVLSDYLCLGVIPTQIQAKWCQNMGTKLKVGSFSYNGSRQSVRLCTFYIQREVIFCDILWYSLLWVIIYALGIVPTQIQAKWCKNIRTKLKVGSFTYNGSRLCVRLSTFYIQREVIFCDILWYSLLWMIIMP